MLLNRITDYPNYLDLLNEEIFSSDGHIDMIVVPQSRPAGYIESAAKLARSANITLISLCSHDAKANDVAYVLKAMKEKAPPVWYVVTVPPGYVLPDITLTASEKIPVQCRKTPGWNLSDKRNIGLALGKMINIDGILFHDDDVRMDTRALQLVERSLSKKHIAGLRCGGYPDKSTVMHAKHEIFRHHLLHFDFQGRDKIKAGQLSGNSLAVNPQKADGYFPLGIYNEDWLFAFLSIKHGLAGLAPKLHYYQDKYDPFTPKRAAQEEFGDLIAEGLYSYLSNLKDDIISNINSLENVGYWQSIIDERRRQYILSLDAIKTARNIDSISNQGHMKAMPHYVQVKLSTSLEASLRVNQSLSGSMLLEYVHAWKKDQKIWRKMMKELPRNITTTEALSYLGLTSYVSSE